MTTFNGEAVNKLIATVRLRKEEAKDFRDDGDIPSAIAVLVDAISELDRSPLSQGLIEIEAPSPQQKKLAFHLADCLGMLGGNYRRLGELAEALDRFTRGREIEESEKLEVPSSYNLVNAITLPLEMQPPTPLQQQRPLLKRAIAAIQRQVTLGERRADRWAWADLGQCQLLVGDLDDAKISYKRVRELGNADTTESVIAVLQRLASALESEPGAAEAVKQGIAWMKSQIS